MKRSEVIIIMLLTVSLLLNYYLFRQLTIAQQFEKEGIQSGLENYMLDIENYTRYFEELLKNPNDEMIYGIALIHKENIRIIRGLRYYNSLDDNLKASLVDLSIHIEDLWSEYINSEKISNLSETDLYTLKQINDNFRSISMEYNSHRFEMSIENLQENLSATINNVILKNNQILK